MPHCACVGPQHPFLLLPQEGVDRIGFLKMYGPRKEEALAALVPVSQMKNIPAGVRLSIASFLRPGIPEWTAYEDLEPADNDPVLPYDFLHFMCPSMMALGFMGMKQIEDRRAPKWNSSILGPRSRI